MLTCQPLTNHCFALLTALCLLLPIQLAHAEQPLIHHELIVTLYPDRHHIEVRDAIRLPEAWQSQKLSFLLSDKLQISAMEGRTMTDMARVVDPTQQGGFHTYQLAPYLPNEQEKQEKAPIPQLILRYSGKIESTMQQPVSGYRGGATISTGGIGEEGVFLGGGTGWVPYFEGALNHFRLTVIMPQGWRSLSQGKPLSHTQERDRMVDVWEAPHPTEAIYLHAGQWHRYKKQVTTRHGQQPLLLAVLLRQADEPLAQSYLQDTLDYINLYEDLIGPYSYDKFVLAENFWETGYGMPSFTLLGSQVIRLPFIRTSSYPHEILHNWWGNGVFVDYAQGNWSEGLTAYMADYLLQEHNHQGVLYRHTTLSKYAGFVRRENDFPLTHFTSRHDGASQAIGYGKGLMFFHMLRRHLGDKMFIQGLRSFYQQYRFKAASYADLRRTFEQISSMDLRPFFTQWTQRAGAPELELEATSIQPDGRGWRLNFTLLQKQPGAPYQLQVPLQVTLQGESQPQPLVIPMQRLNQTVSRYFSSRPERLDIDPAFDLFRTLHAGEIPPTLSALFGHPHILAVLPSKGPLAEQQALRRLVHAWGLSSVQDDQLTNLPTDQALWILGQHNRFREQALAPLRNQGVEVVHNQITLAGKPYELAKHSVVTVTRQGKQPIAWLSPQADQIDALIRKLPHYGAYGHLLFAGDSSENLLRGKWSQTQYPLSVVFDAQGQASTAQSAPTLAPELSLTAP
ncbi:peptidase M28 [Magnetococcus marinus MC-1]|uniref:Peptidase M28 n=1 Tax=Magnetococcus marinus (strain ATCC BAA-1437 / JCM 17883 / MC-1) TaxID=156889 RepID=A0L7F4_MAGMM|nr:M1 family aminopeptidase [Magnetococcus marinus]ABK43897.1 peptidase M28 [Magnetococcus marinus MC-1]